MVSLRIVAVGILVGILSMPAGMIHVGALPSIEEPNSELFAWVERSEWSDFINLALDFSNVVTYEDASIVKLRAPNWIIDSPRMKPFSVIRDYRSIYVSGVPRDFRELEQDLRKSTSDCGGSEPYGWVVRFVGPVKNEWLNTLEDEGAIDYGYVPQFSRLMWIPPEEQSHVRNLPFVQAVLPYARLFKDLPIHMLANPHEPKWWDVFIFNSTALPRVPSVRFSSERLFLEPYELSKILCRPDIFAVFPASAYSTYDEISAEIVGGADSAKGSHVNALGYTGRGIVVAILDTGLDDGMVSTMHPDLAGRVVGLIDFVDATGWQEGEPEHKVAADHDTHGTHIAGIVAGNGAVGTKDSNGYYYGIGVAPESLIVAEKMLGPPGPIPPGWDRGADIGLVKNIFDKYDVKIGATTWWELLRYAEERGATIDTNSWGDWGTDAGAGYYMYDASTFDFMVRDANSDKAGDQPMTIVFAAGNSGPSPTTLLQQGSAKNVISVGASENERPDDGGSEADNRNDMADFSSRGPTVDQRIKPDLVAPGTWIASARSSYPLPGVKCGSSPLLDSDYIWCKGTSMAAPHVAGAAALFEQYYMARYGDMPSPALVKAALINGADDMQGSSTGSIPNYDQGWGRVNVENILDSSIPMLYYDQKSALSTGQTATFTFTPSEIGSSVKITLAWTDEAAIPGCNPCLVNDLDLEVTSPSMETYKGNVFSEGWSIPGDSPWDLTPDTGFDDRNNVENIYLPSGSEGEYMVKVHARNTGGHSQDFALVIRNVAETSMKSFLINEGAIGTKTQTVDLNIDLFHSGSAAQMRFRNEGTASWSSYGVSPQLESDHGQGWSDLTYVLAPWDMPQYFPDDPYNPYMSRYRTVSIWGGYYGNEEWIVQGFPTTPRMRVGFQEIYISPEDSVGVYSPCSGQSYSYTGLGLKNIWTPYMNCWYVIIRLKDNPPLGNGVGFRADIYTHKASPDTYLPNYNECWTIDYNKDRINGNHKTRIHFEFIDLGIGDYLTVWDSTGEVGTLQGTDWSGFWLPDKFSLPGVYGDVKLCLVSNSDSSVGRGFRVDYYEYYTGYARGIEKQWTLRKAGSEQIMVHFYDWGIAPGDSLSVTNPDGTTEYVIRGTGWSPPIDGDTLVIHFRSNLDYLTDFGFVVDQFAACDYGWSAWEPFSETKNAWSLSPGDGMKTVWVQVMDLLGNVVHGISPIFLDTGLPGQGQLLSPTCPSQTYLQRPTFSWSPFDGSDPSPSSGLKWFHFELSTSQTFQSLTVDAHPATNSFTSPSLEPYTYYWRVKSEDNAGNQAPEWSLPYPCLIQVLGTGVQPPGGLTIERNPPFLRLEWNAVVGADWYRVYESQDRFLPFESWNYLGSTPSTLFLITGQLDDGLDHYYVVRTVDGGIPSWSSTMAVKHNIQVEYVPGQLNGYWYSLPYRSDYAKASDIANELGTAKISVVAKWNPTTQQSISYYYLDGYWRGTDFDIGAGDGLLIGAESSFDWVIVGTDFSKVLSFTHNSPPMSSYYFISHPYTAAYAKASDIVFDIEGDVGGGANSWIIEVGIHNWASQTWTKYYWTPYGWHGIDFTFGPGDGIYIKVVAIFDWTPELVTPEVPP